MVVISASTTVTGAAGVPRNAVIRIARSLPMPEEMNLATWSAPTKSFHRRNTSSRNMSPPCIALASEASSSAYVVAAIRRSASASMASCSRSSAMLCASGARPLSEPASARVATSRRSSASAARRAIRSRSGRAFSRASPLTRGSTSPLLPFPLEQWSDGVQ